MKASKQILFFLLSALFLFSCQKEITVELPEAEEKLVIEGTIEPGQPPIVLVTRTQGYFEPTDLNALGDIFVAGATIILTDGTHTDTLTEICSQNIPPAQLPLIAELTGLSPNLLAAINICAYTITDFTSPLLGTIGNTYTLTVQAEGKTLSAQSTLPEPARLDSVWFQLEDSLENDTLGFAWALLDDPDTTGNFFRWSARRINRYANGEVKDPNFIAPLGSVFDDRFLNGISFEFFAFRGTAPFSSKEDDNNEENSRFKVGDTVVVKFLSMNEDEYEFYRTFETNYASAGDLFTTPTNIRSNVNGGLGVWAALGTYYDTIICLP